MLTLLTLTTVLAMQDPPAPPPPPSMTDMRVTVLGGPEGRGALDKDGDGQVSREEFSAPMTDAFGRMDTDGDGRLSPEEMAAGHGPRGDGNVMFIRRPGGPGGEDGPRRFELRRLDGAPGEDRVMVFSGGEPGDHGDHQIIIRDGDGHGEPMIIGGPDGDGPGAHRVEIRRMGGPGEHADMDANGDGKISEDEFVAPMREAFGRMDADHSGFIEDGEHGDDSQVHVFTRRIERSGDEHHDGDHS